jgi:hypothetical protein
MINNQRRGEQDMKIYLRLINPIFGLDCNDFEFKDVYCNSNGTHFEIRDKTSMQLEFKCRLDNIDSLAKEE